MADLAQRLEVAGRRIVVLAGPGDRRDEDLIAIARAVAGRFDHYICRRDDNLRDRKPDEVPRIQAAALKTAGVPEEAISIIPDEQEAISTALQMGQPGDLLLIFADALVRSWKQIIKFKPAGVTAPALPPPPPMSFEPSADGAVAVSDAAGTFSLEGLIRDERGVHFAPEAED
jgi:cyanophycin synthetase